MENKNLAFFNSPVIHKNTPIKRLGLSRKRKSCGSVCGVNAKIKAYGDKFSESPTHSEKCHPEKETEDPASDTEDEDKSNLNYEKEIEILKREISQDEEKLKALKCNKENINQLEGLIELWKNGCKNAYLHFTQLLKDREADSIDLKAVLHKLGVWETMMENFESDSELSLSEYSQ